MVNMKKTLIGAAGSLILLTNFLFAEPAKEKIEWKENKMILESELQHIGDNKKEDWVPKKPYPIGVNYTKPFDLEEVPEKVDIIVYSVFAIVDGNNVYINGNKVGDLSHKSKLGWFGDYLIHGRKIPPKINRYDVSSYLKKGENTLEIKSGIHGKGKKQQYNDLIIGYIDLEKK